MRASSLRYCTDGTDLAYGNLGHERREEKPKRCWASLYSSPRFRTLTRLIRIISIARRILPPTKREPSGQGARRWKARTVKKQSKTDQRGASPQVLLTERAELLSRYQWHTLYQAVFIVLLTGTIHNRSTERGKRTQQYNQG